MGWRHSARPAARVHEPAEPRCRCWRGGTKAGIWWRVARKRPGGGCARRAAGGAKSSAAPDAAADRGTALAGGQAAAGYSPTFERTRFEHVVAPSPRALGRFARSAWGCGAAQGGRPRAGAEQQAGVQSRPPAASHKGPSQTLTRAAGSTSRQPRELFYAQKAAALRRLLLALPGRHLLVAGHYRSLRRVGRAEVTKAAAAAAAAAARAACGCSTPRAPAPRAHPR